MPKKLAKKEGLYFLGSLLLTKMVFVRSSKESWVNLGTESSLLIFGIFKNYFTLKLPTIFIYSITASLDIPLKSL